MKQDDEQEIQKDETNQGEIRVEVKTAIVFVPKHNLINWDLWSDLLWSRI